MTLEHLASTLEALQKAEVRFLIAGGLAVVAHGHSRVTHDIDLVLALDPGNTRNAITVLTGLGFSPRIPVDPFDFCDTAKRESWVREKNLQVFSMTCPEMNGLVVDLFAEAPFPFDEEWSAAAQVDLPGLPAPLPFVSKATLLEMKRRAGRTIDLDDVKHLEGGA